MIRDGPISSRGKLLARRKNNELGELAGFKFIRRREDSFKSGTAWCQFAPSARLVTLGNGELRCNTKFLHSSARTASVCINLEFIIPLHCYSARIFQFSVSIFYFFLFSTNILLVCEMNFLSKREIDSNDFALRCCSKVSKESFLLRNKRK